MILELFISITTTMYLCTPYVIVAKPLGHWTAEQVWMYVALDRT